MRRGSSWLVVVSLFLLATAEARAAVTVNYSNIGTYNVTTLDLGGATVTGSSTIHVHQNDGSWSGLGIVGGTIWPYYTYVDSGESITFSFNTGAAKDVWFHSSSVFGSGTAYANIAAVAPGGASMGSVVVNLFSSPYDRDVSVLFGNAPMQSFTVTALYNGGQPTGFNIWRLDFSPQDAAVPEPSALIIWSAAGLGAAGLAAWRRRHPSRRRGWSEEDRAAIFAIIERGRTR